MKYIFVQRLVVTFFTIATLASCADYLSDTNSRSVNGKIGLPGGVNILNSEVSPQTTKASNSVTIPDINTRTAFGGGRPLFCRYTTTPGITPRKREAKSNIATRGSAITTNNFYDSYSLYSYVYSGTMTWAVTTQSSGAAYNETYFDEEVKSSKGWATSEFWPGEREKCTFFAYAPYHAKGLSNFTVNNWSSFHYSVPLNVTEQNDLLVTKNDISTGSNDYGNIDVPGDFNKPDSITFDHACTAIRFAIGDQMAPGIIKKIRICNVYGSGDYNYATESWSNVDSLKTFTLTQDFEIKSGEHNKLLNNDDNVFMMIPQQVPLKGFLEITINDGTDHIIKSYIERDQWLKGYTVTYYLSTAKVGSSYVLSMAAASGNIGCTGGTKAVTINSYKQTYYGTLTPVPWTASYTYDDADEIGTTVYNASTAVVPGFTVSGTGSTTGKSTNFQVASQVARSKSWRSSHTQTLRNAPDGSGDLADGKQTANCYIIQAPGTYTFPLVYGNALNADGSSNNDSYGTSTFVDHAGVQISSPYIYDKYTPYDACIVWQDAPHLVTPASIKLTDSNTFIQFTVERKNICAGNCVIAVRDKDQNIMWSWHIWVTDHDMTNTIPVTNQDGIVSKFMEVPLGWCDEEVRVYDKRTFHLTVKQSETGGQSATADILQLSADSTYEYGVNAPYYQWGRKDPFLPSNGMGNIDKPYYDNQYPVFTNSYGAVATNVAILHPNIFYFVLDASWSADNKYDFWNKNYTDATVNNYEVKKTIYSPSPTGYAEPKTAAFIGFTTTRNNSGTASEFNVSGGFNKGWNFYCQPKFQGNTIFFSALGFRDVYSGRVNTSNAGAVAHVSGTGYYWSAGPSSTSTVARSLFFYSGNVSPQDEFIRAFGFTVRSASE